MSENKKVTIDFSFSLYTTLIFITLLVLKVTHVWDISWWWVFSPFWIPIAGIISIGLVMMVVNVYRAKKARKEAEKEFEDLKAKYSTTEPKEPKQYRSKFSEMLAKQLEQAEVKKGGQAND